MGVRLGPNWTAVDAPTSEHKAAAQQVNGKAHRPFAPAAGCARHSKSVDSNSSRSPGGARVNTTVAGMLTAS